VFAAYFCFPTSGKNLQNTKSTKIIVMGDDFKNQNKISELGKRTTETKLQRKSHAE
jgi:hypothetical protein